MSKETKTELPRLPKSGKTYEVRDGKGKDLLQATRIAKDPAEVTFALVATLCKVDGEAVLMEDLLELDLQDVLTLQGAVQGNSPT